MSESWGELFVGAFVTEGEHGGDCNVAEALLTVGDKVKEGLADALLSTLTGDNTNLTDAAYGIERQLERLAEAVKGGAGTAQDAAGGTVGSVTEAVMGITAGLYQVAGEIEVHGDHVANVALALVQIANAINRLADAVDTFPSPNRE